MYLSRPHRKLLKTVNGKDHATEDDHISSDAATAAPLPTPPDTGRQSRSKRKSKPGSEVIDIDDDPSPPMNEKKEEDDDPYRDPVSSDDDMASKKAAAGFVDARPSIPDRKIPEESKMQFKKTTVPTLKDETDNVKKAAFCLPGVTSASTTAPKRDRELVGDAELDEDSDGPIFSSQPKKKPKTSGNIHVAPRSSQQKNFGSRQKETDQRRKVAEEIARKKKKRKEEKENERKKFKSLDINLRSGSSAAATFKRHDLPSLKGSTTAGATDGVSNVDGDSSPLSSLSASPEPDPMGIVCETCHERVNKLVKEEYDDEYVKGKSWNIQWQERFCEWHRTQTAKESWKERGYPDIDWTGLERRMQQHDPLLLCVLRNEKKSQHRDEYAAKVKAKSMSGGFKDSKIKPGATVGYYGPKGEKAMSEHILSGLSDEIRQRAKTDRLVSPSGYQGGISGFVQGVLVPHLAELMIKDDMKLKGQNWAVRARELIAESAEMGELVNPETADRNPQVEGEGEGQDDWMLQ